jgi:hypothetical protein
VLRPLPSLRAAMRHGVTRKVDKLATVRIGSARYSVPHTLRGRRVDVSTVDDRIEIWHQDLRVAQHRLVPPGGPSILDEHYYGPARKPQRAVRPRTSAEKDFLALGEEAVAFLRAAAAAGTTRLPPTSPTSPLCAPRTEPRRWPPRWAGRSSFAVSRPKMRAILTAGPAAPTPAPAGQALPGPRPAVPTRGWRSTAPVDRADAAGTGSDRGAQTAEVGHCAPVVAAELQLRIDAIAPVGAEWPCWSGRPWAERW